MDDQEDRISAIPEMTLAKDTHSTCPVHQLNPGNDDSLRGGRIELQQLWHLVSSNSNWKICLPAMVSDLEFCAVVRIKRENEYKHNAKILHLPYNFLIVT